MDQNTAHVAEANLAHGFNVPDKLVPIKKIRF